MNMPRLVIGRYARMWYPGAFPSLFVHVRNKSRRISMTLRNMKLTISILGWDFRELHLVWSILWSESSLTAWLQRLCRFCTASSVVPAVSSFPKLISKAVGWVIYEDVLAHQCSSQEVRLVPFRKLQVTLPLQYCKSSATSESYAPWPGTIPNNGTRRQVQVSHGRRNGTFSPAVERTVSSPN